MTRPRARSAEERVLDRLREALPARDGVRSLSGMGCLHVLSMLRNRRRASIVGPAGSGKTVLAMEKARRAGWRCRHQQRQLP